MSADVIPFADAVARLRAKRARAMFNTRLFNIHDFLLIGGIAIIAHILLKPLLARIDLTSADETDASTTG